MPEALDRAVRFFVAEGSGLKREQVFEGDEDKLPRPPEPYATLLPGVNQRMGYPITYYYPETETTAQMVYRRQFYSLQFYRKGALANTLKTLTIGLNPKTGCSRQRRRSATGALRRSSC